LKKKEKRISGCKVAVVFAYWILNLVLAICVYVCVI
jgi:hypothetical protein